MESLYENCQYYVNHVIPKDSIMLRKLYQDNGEQSKVSGWEKIHTSILIPRLIKGPLTIPLALVDSGCYVLRGVFKASVKVLDGNFNNALQALTQDFLSALQCLAVAVASVAYAVIGLAIGSAFYSQFIPQIEKEISQTEEITKSLENKIKNLEDQIAKQPLKSDQNLNNQKIAKLEEELKNKNALLKDIENNKTKLEELRKELQDKECDLKQFRDLVPSLEKKIAQHELELQQRIAQDELEIQSVRDKYFESKNYILEKYRELCIENLRLKNLEKPLAEIPLNISGRESLPLSSGSTPTKETQPEIIPSENKLVSGGGLITTTFNGMTNILTNWMIQPTLELGLRILDKTCQYFFDQKDPWKIHRYEVALEQIKKVFGVKEIESLKRLEKLSNSKDNLVLEKLQTALNILTSPEIYDDVRNQKKQFYLEIREVLTILQQPNHGVSKELENRINSLCTKWMTSIEMNPFNYQMALYVASKGNEEVVHIVNNSKASLHDKIKGLLDGIAKAPAAVKAPPSHTSAAKVGVIKASYDTLLKDNFPSKIATMVYKKEGEKARTIQEYRTGVPVGPRSSDRKMGDKPWEIEDIALVPEFMGFLNDLKAKNAAKTEGQSKEKLLVVLHLNPEYYNTDEDNVQPSGTLDVTKPISLKRKEALWIKLFRQLSLDPAYKDVLSVALIPMDGKWLEEGIHHCIEDKTLSQLHNHLRRTILQKNSPYIIPNATAQEKKDLIDSVLKGVTDQYFAFFADDKRTLNKEQMLAFTGTFNGQLVEAIQIREKATFVQRNCKDAVDRTMALVGIQLLERYLRLGQLYIQKNLEKIFGTICGPALGITKRELLKHRQPILLAAAAYFDWLKKNNVKIGLPPVYEGYSLESIHMGEDPFQTLYPTPSRAKTEKDYMDLLNFEKEHPFAVSNYFVIDHLPEKIDKENQDKTRGEIYNQMSKNALDLLQQRYNAPHIHNQVVEVECPQKTKDSIKKLYHIHHADGNGGKKVLGFEGEIKIDPRDGSISFQYKIEKK